DVVGSDHDEPSVAVRLLVHEFRSLIHQRVAIRDRAGEWAVDVGDRLRRLHLAQGLAGFHPGTDLRKVHVHDVAERILREVGDADPDTLPLDPGPLVFLGVPKLLWELHGHASSSSVESPARSLMRTPPTVRTIPAGGGARSQRVIAR